MEDRRSRVWEQAREDAAEAVRGKGAADKVPERQANDDLRVAEHRAKEAVPTVHEQSRAEVVPEAEEAPEANSSSPPKK